MISFNEECRNVVKSLNLLKGYIPTMDQLKEDYPEKYNQIRSLEKRIDKHDISALKSYKKIWESIINI